MAQPGLPGTTLGDHGALDILQAARLDFVVDRLEPAIERAERAGAKRESAISQHAWGRMALFSDPFGHGFCLLEFQNGGYDAIASPGSAT